MFDNVYFEISGICNARCYFCQTGQSNINKIPTGKFVNFEEFKKSIKYLKEQKFLKDNSLIYLYNWGEPFLHPKFKEIINFLHDNNFRTVLSTNASKPVFFEKGNSLNNLARVTFSIPGFSQSSYDKIHGFNFEKIKKNIIDISKNFREAGFNGRFLIAFHIYQFNMHEIMPMIEFANEHGIEPMPSLASINDFERGKKYLKKELDYDYLYKASQELFLFYMDSVLEKMPDDYVCRQFSILSIDSDCNIITCCGDNTIFDKVYNLKPQEVDEWRKNSEACKECRSIGQCYMGEVFVNSQLPKNIITIR